MWVVRWGPVGIGYVRPVQFLDHLTVIINEMMKREKLINLSVRHEKQKEKRKREEKRKMQQPGSLASVPPRSRRDNKLSATKKKETF